MEILVDSRQMKQCDKNTIEHFGVLSLVLMERAALRVTEEIESRFLRCSQPEEKGKSEKPREALLVCGQGNNGGDGLAIGRMLWQKGYSVTIVMPPENRKMSAETKTQKEILEKYNIPVVHQIPEKQYDVVVDALFGIGLTRDLEGIYREYILKMNGLSGFKVAVDIPSGIHADTGEVMGVGFQADMTVTFAFGKPGLLLFPGAAYAGRVMVKDIGIDHHSFLEEQPTLYRLAPEDLSRIPSRRANTNKGSYGKILVAAGQKNMAGAAFFSAKAAYLTGAGLVKVVTAEENRVILQQLLPEAILETYGAEKEIEIRQSQDGMKIPEMPELLKLEDKLKQSLLWASAVVAGPGLGTGRMAETFVRQILAQAKIPVILDADGLNVVSEHLEWLRAAQTPVIVTPHLGEMARLVKKDIFTIQKQLLQVAQDFAGEYNVICVLKDARTITALPDGRAWVNTSGNNGMATAGSGDVLTGVIAGLVAQGMEPEMAAPVGVYLHGMAGDMQVSQKGAYSLMAQDILAGISQVLMSVPGRPQGQNLSERTGEMPDQAGSR